MDYYISPKILCPWIRCIPAWDSIGSASQGLRTLRSLKAVRTAYVAGDRRDHYFAETEFRRLFSNFIKDEIMPHLDSAKDRIGRMEKTLPNQSSAERMNFMQFALKN